MISIVRPKVDPRYNDNTEQIYDDKFSTPIWQLMFKYKPDSVSAVQKVLEDNGYFGRAKAVRIREFGKITNKIKVSIYLPDSGYTYNWPLNNWYDITTKRLCKKVKFNKPQLWFGTIHQVMLAMHDPFVKMQKESDDKISALQVVTNIGMSHCRKAFMIILKAELLDTDYNLKVSATDVEEVFKNFFDERLIELITV